MATPAASAPHAGGAGAPTEYHSGASTDPRNRFAPPDAARLFAARSVCCPPLRRGQAVHVNAAAVWLPATITTLAATRVGVAYSPGAPAWMAGIVPAWTIRPAEGVILRPAGQLRAGDQVLDADGTAYQVQRVRGAGHRGWVIDYTGGGHAVVVAGAILRLLDPTPAVSVHGIRL